MFRNVKELIEITKEKQILISDVMIGSRDGSNRKNKRGHFSADGS